MVDPYEPRWLEDKVDGALPDSGLSTWIPTGEFAASALRRVQRYPFEVPEATTRTLALDAVRNEQQSGQVVVIADEPIETLRVTFEEFEAESGAVLPSEAFSSRFVEFLPVVRGSSEYTFSAVIEDVVDDQISGARAPDLVGDPLLEAESIDVPARRAQPIWITLEVPREAAPGTYHGGLTVETESFEDVTYDLSVTVRDVTLPDPTDYEFHLDVWLNPSALAAAHDLEPWSERHWARLEAAIEDLASRSQGMILTTIIEEPWQQGATPFESMVTWHRDDGTWSFDYTVFDRFVETALAKGVGPEIAAYSILTFDEPERVTYYEDGERIVEELEAGSDRWRECWTAFLTDFERHLTEQGWLRQTVLAIDEREEEAMQAVSDLLADTVPGFADRIQLAGLVEAAEGVYDFAANFTNEMPLEREFVEERRAAGKRTTFYTAGRPNHPNTLAFSPAVESRLLPWIAAANDLDGYLRWAYNNWPTNVRENPVHGFVQGDEYFVYPGDDGPDSSIRWELLREGIEDYELAKRLRETAPDATNLDVALDLATREHDGREADRTDIPRSRELLVDALE